MIELTVPATTPAASLTPEAMVTAAYERHHAELHGHLTKVTRDPEAAADLVQEAFLKLLIEGRARHAPDNVRAWLYRVAINAAVSQSRRARTAQVFGDRIPAPVPELGPEDAYLRGEAHRAVEGMLAATASDERRALLLAAHGADGQEIARAIGRTHGATRTLLSRARARIREQAVTLVA